MLVDLYVAASLLLVVALLVTAAVEAYRQSPAEEPLPVRIDVPDDRRHRDDRDE